ETKPTQVTLVPDSIQQLTSNHGWDTIQYKSELQEYIQLFKSAGIRVSIFVDPEIEMIQGAKECGTDRIELYTERYARLYLQDKEKAIAPYKICAEEANRLGLEVNAGH